MSDNFLSSYGLSNKEIDKNNLDSHFESSAYWDWFKDQGDNIFIGAGGGNNHELIFDIELADFFNNTPNNSSETYEIEKIAIDDMKIYSENGWITPSNLVWDKLNRYSLLINNENSDLDDNLGTEGEDSFYKDSEGRYVLEPTYNTENEESEKWVNLFKLNDGELNEWTGDSQADPEMSYLWNKGDSHIKFKFKNSADWIYIVAGGSYHFATFIDMTYDEYVVRDENDYYSLEKDEFNSKEVQIQTQKNLNSLGAISTNSSDEVFLKSLPSYNFNSSESNIVKKRPYFTSENKYSDLEKIILKNDIIESRDQLKTSESDSFGIDFYDESGTNLIDKNSNLDTQKINFRLTTTGDAEEHIIIDENSNDPNKDQSELMTYYIPYFDISFINKDLDDNFVHNIYDYDDQNTLMYLDGDPSDNTTNFNWEFNKTTEKWVLKTNVPFILNANYDNGISAVEWTDGGDLHSDVQLNEENKVITNLTHKQIVKSETNNINYDVSFQPVVGEESFDFTYSYRGESNFDAVNILDENGIDIHENPEMIVEGYDNVMLDIDTDENNESTSDKILKGYVVNKPFQFNVDDSYSNIKINEDVNGEFGGEKVYDVNETIFKPGVYGISVIDEYGNNSFTVVEYAPTPEEQNSILYSESEDYEQDYDAFSYQDGTDKVNYDTYTSSELRYLDSYVYEDKESEVIDLNKLLTVDPIKTTKLEEVTNKFELGTMFAEKVDLIETDSFGEKTTRTTTMKDELNSLIKEEMYLRGVDSSKYEVVWNNVNDQSIITDDINISYAIQPKGYWQTRGTYTSDFVPKSYVSIDTFDFDLTKLSLITNDFIQGITLDDNVVDIKGEEHSINDAIIAEITNEIVNQGIDRAIVEENLVFESLVNKSNETPVYYGDEITYIVHSNEYIGDGNFNLIKGKRALTFKAQVREDISKLEIDNNELTNVTKDYFIGTQFLQFEDALKEEVYSQLNEYGINRDEVSIVFDKNQFSPLASAEEISYSIIPKSSKYINTIEGTFSTEPFTSLDALNINALELMKITNKYNSGVQFNKIEPELTSYLYSNLEDRGLNKEWFEIQWTNDSESIIDYNTKIGYKIVSLDETKLRGECAGQFNAWSFYDLNTFVIDSEPIYDIVNPYIEEQYVLFSEIRPLLEEEIFKQLNEQGFYHTTTNDAGTEIQILNIDWSRGDGERVSLGQTMDFEIYSNNELISNYVIKGAISNNSIQFGTKPEPKQSLKFSTFIEIILILVSITFILMIGMIIKNKYKFKKKK